MTDKPTCVRCGRPTDAVACHHCAHDLTQALTEAAGHAEDAWTVLARQTRYGTGSRGGNSESLPVDLTASTRYAGVSLAVGGWMRALIEEGYTAEPEPWRPIEGPLCPPVRPGDELRQGNRCKHPSCAGLRDQEAPSALAEACGWLAGHAQALRKHPDAGAAFKELHDACAQLERLVDRPADKVLVGVCDCGRVLYASLGRQVIRCPERTCGATWNVADGLEILRRHLNDKLFTEAEAARLAVRLDGGDRSTDQIRRLIGMWAARGQIGTRGQVWREPNTGELERDPNHGPVAVPTYRFGDVADRLARTPRRNREGAAA